MKSTCNYENERRQRGGSECAVGNYQTHTTSSCVGTYTLSVMMVQSVVSHHLYQNGQFWGLSGSFGLSQVTKLGSSLGFGRKLDGASFFVGGCRETLRPVPYASMWVSPNSVSNFISRTSSCTIVEEEECTGEG